MIDINWNNYKSKFNGRERNVFESLSYMLFCYEYGIKIGVFRFKNQIGIETEPIEVNGANIGFQAKYYDTKLADNKDDIIDSVKKAKSKNSTLNKILIYTNQELSESKGKNQKKPKYLTTIEKAAQQLNLEIEWRLPSHLEKQLSVPENDYLAQYFFGFGKGIIEFLDNLKAHTENILFAIQTDILFKEHQIKIERGDILTILEQNSSQIIILSGDGGSGKTALIKDFIQGNIHACYVFKAVEFHKPSLSIIFNQFGNYGIADFLFSHKEETNKVFVIDSAEKLSDLDNQDVFTEFLSALIKDDWKIIFTTRNSYLDDLCFQMLEVYRLSFDVVRLINLSQDELKKLSEMFKFKLPDDTRLQSLICNLFYLNEYLSNYDTINDLTDIEKFQNILWQKKIQNSKFKKDNIHLDRERCFLSLAKTRCDSGNFFLKGELCDSRTLSLLEGDEIIKYEPSQNGYFITHDIYEEWALEKLIEREYTALSSYPSFFEKIGNSLPIRRAFRSWLSDKLLQTDSGIKHFIEEVFNEKTVPIFWKDELLVSVLLSDYSFAFFKIFDSVLLENKKLYLKKIIFLLRTACKEVDNAVQKILEAKKDFFVSPAYVFTKPKGKGWGATIEYLFSKIADIQKDELAFVLPVLKEWTDKHPNGNTTRLAGLFALHFYKNSELNSSTYYGSEIKKLLLKIVLSCARELIGELIKITDELINGSYSRRETFDSLRKTVLTSNYESLAYIVTLPEYVIRLADISWHQPKTEKHPFDFGGTGVEGYYSIRSQWHHKYHPASALQTPVYYLLMVVFPQTIKFILDFTNRAVEAYFASGFDSSVREIEVMIGSVKTKQFISSGLWDMYRGMGSPVTPYLLQSIHMALEKYLLGIAKSTDKKVLQGWLIHLLKNTRSASITAVVTSLVLAYPDDLFEVAVILFSNYEFFRYDNQRAGSESHAKSLYSIGRGMNRQSKEFDDERIATCDDPHRKLSLENLALQYQFFKKESVSDEEADKRKNEIWRIIDNLYTTIPSGDAETEQYKAMRLLLTRIDRRKMNPIVSKVEDKLLIEFNPALEPDLKKYSEEGTQEFQAKFKYTSLKLWATGKFDTHTQYGSYPQYEENPELVLKETREIVEGLQKQDDEFNLFNGHIPAYTCAALIKLYSDKLLADDILFCSQIIINYATAPLQENYGYQIADGVEVAISTLPFLYKIYPENRFDYNIILLLILFDAYPIGEYKRICDYTVEALNNSLFEFSADDANAILLGYLTFKPKFDLDYSSQNYMRERKSRSQVLQEFINKYEAELEKIESSQEYYNKIDFNALEILTAETVFQIIPVDSVNPIHLDYIKKVLTAHSRQLLAETHYSDTDTEADYRLKHRFFRKFAKFLLHREVSTLKEWTQPFIDAFIISREMANFLSDIVSEEDRLGKYDSFWAIWECFYPSIKSVAKKFTTNRDLDEIIRNYMLAWPYWKETAKEWRSLKKRDTLFFKKICAEMGHHPAVLFSIAKLLNEIGNPFLNDGIVWIADMLYKNKRLHTADLHPNTVYYLEIIARKFVYINRTKLKSNRLIKDKMLVLLNFLVAKGSVNGYLLREDIF